MSLSVAKETLRIERLHSRRARNCLISTSTTSLPASFKICNDSRSLTTSKRSRKFRSTLMWRSKTRGITEISKTFTVEVYWLNPDSPLIHHLPEICGNFSTGQLVLYRNQHPHRRDQILSSSLELPGLTHNILPGLLHFIGMVFGACFVLPSSHVFPQHCSPTACHHNYIYIAVSILPVCNDYSHLKDL